jgi:hypothetical protein
MDGESSPGDSHSSNRDRRAGLVSINGMSRPFRGRRLFPMKKTAQHLIAEVPCGRFKVEMTIGIDSPLERHPHRVPRKEPQQSANRNSVENNMRRDQGDSKAKNSMKERTKNKA